MSCVCREYGWTAQYVLNDLTYLQAMMFYEHAIAWIGQKDVDYDEDPDPLQGAVKREDGAMVYNR